MKIIKLIAIKIKMIKQKMIKINMMKGKQKIHKNLIIIINLLKPYKNQFRNYNQLA